MLLPATWVKDSQRCLSTFQALVLLKLDALYFIIRRTANLGRGDPERRLNNSTKQLLPRAFGRYYEASEL